MARSTRRRSPGTLEMEVSDVARSPAASAAGGGSVGGGSAGGGSVGERFEPVVLRTSRGNIEMRYYPVEGATRAAIFVGGAGGGFDTPVRGWLYPRLCEDLSAHDGIAALRVRYREPAELMESTLDVLAGIAFLEAESITAMALAGHSFGGAVVIQAAAASPAVRACAALSTQSYGADPASTLGPRCALLLAHGEADEVLPPDCSRHVYQIARQPKQLLLHPAARHGLDEWSEELPGIVRAWIRSTLGEAAMPT